MERALGGKIFVVHRLDREASGLMIFAKDAASHRLLCGLFERREVHKRYAALVMGRLAEDGVVDRPLREFGSGRTSVDPQGKESLTRYKVVEPFKNATLLEVSPVTGRRHQIRAHLYAIGHPILGDTLYGKQRPVGGAPRLMLHALEASFELEAGKPLTLRVEPPDDFADALKIARAS